MPSENGTPGLALNPTLVVLFTQERRHVVPLRLLLPQTSSFPLQPVKLFLCLFGERITRLFILT